jgi:hypothetical protein
LHPEAPSAFSVDSFDTYKPINFACTVYSPPFACL